MSTLGDAADVNSVIKFLLHTCVAHVSIMAAYAAVTLTISITTLTLIPDL